MKLSLESKGVDASLIASDESSASAWAAAIESVIELDKLLLNLMAELEIPGQS